MLCLVGYEMDFVKVIGYDGRRSTTNVDKVITYIDKNPKSFTKLLKLLLSENELLRMRAIDAIEKISRGKIELLTPHKSMFLNKVALINQKEIRWHIAQILPRLSLTKHQLNKAYKLFVNIYILDESKIVQTFTLQALFDISLQHGTYHDEVKKTY